MRSPVFLSYPQPFNAGQEAFITALKSFMQQRNLEPRTLGVTDYDTDVPLRAIRRLMLESNGVITVAFRRTFITKGESRPGTKKAYSLTKKWLTSPYAHIEPAMAFQLGLPTLILREAGVVPEGVLEKGIVGTYMPEFEIADDKAPNVYLESEEWQQLLQKFSSQVDQVRSRKGEPPRIY